MMLKKFVDRGGGVRSLGSRGIIVGTKSNINHRFFGGCVGMERRNGAVDEKKLGIRGFMERINFGLVSLVGCNFNEIHGVTRDGAKQNLVIIAGTRVPFDSA